MKIFHGRLAIAVTFRDSFLEFFWVPHYPITPLPPVRRAETDRPVQRICRLYFYCIGMFIGQLLESRSIYPMAWAACGN